MQLGECVLVGDVVPEVEDGAGRRLRAQGVDGGALVGRDQRELDHVLAVRDVGPGPGGGPVADRLECMLANLGSGAANVHRDARRLRLQTHARMGTRDRRQLGEELVVKLAELRVEALDEAEVELGAVAADEMHLARQP